MNSNTESWEHATLKGALIWGAVYSTTFGGSAYMLVPALTDSTPAFSELLKNAFVIFPFAGAFRGALMWRIKNGYNAFRAGKKKGE
ncbi:MAG: hypothetical protein U9P12_08965 [Verrucomicrobiota bacterium]|nr:hypothetical protein [Verrucomicrobiota bacterium]